MSRQGPAAARNLTLTEELEKLEQSITLTLQEIDHNFSRAHRIVTSSILPIVEQYAKHSEAVWEGSKFWKQFFEASANVSLTGYEEAAEGPEAEDGTYVEHITTAGSSALGSRAVTPVEGSEGAVSEGEGAGALDDVDDSLLTSPSVAHATSTPRLPTTASKTRGKAAAAATGTTTQPRFAEYPSPYESLKREMQYSSSPAQPPPEPTVALSAVGANPITPGRRTSALPDMSMTPDSSPFAMPPATADRAAAAASAARVNNDPLLHRMLDKNYRIAATPHTQRRQQAAAAYGRAGASAATPSATARSLFGGNTSNKDSTNAGTGGADEDDELGSSPLVAPPQLRADLFSPAKVARIPGVSVQTPGARRQIRKSLEARGRTHTPAKDKAKANAKGGAQQQQHAETPAAYSDSDGGGGGGGYSDSDDDLMAGLSPPKTMQFHIPQSRVLQTPAREASRRIVQDLLLTAGGDISDTEELDGAATTGAGRADGDAAAAEGVEDSPSVVRPGRDLDDSF